MALSLANPVDERFPHKINDVESAPRETAQRANAGPFLSKHLNRYEREVQAVSTESTDGASHPNIPQKQRARRALVQNVRFLLWSGETHIEAIARRCDTNPRALVRRLGRAGRGDLVARMTGKSEDAIRGRVA